MINNFIELVIPVYAIGKERPRVGKYGFIYTPKKTVKLENIILKEYKEKYGERVFFDKGVAISVTITFYFEIPESKKKQFEKKKLTGRALDAEICTCRISDLDNLEKTVLDALRNKDRNKKKLKKCLECLEGHAYHDDVQVVEFDRILKRFCNKKYAGPTIVIRIKKYNRDLITNELLDNLDVIREFVDSEKHKLLNENELKAFRELLASTWVQIVPR